MKIIVFSDSHRNIQPMLRAVAQNGPDMILHLGDYITDCKVLRNNFPQIQLRAVKGNGDFSAEGPISDTFLCEGKKIFMTHGHMYGVKTGIASLINVANGNRADVVLFGHTHREYFEKENDMFIINPGSIGYGRQTYGLLTIESGRITYQNCLA